MYIFDAVIIRTRGIYLILSMLIRQMLPENIYIVSRLIYYLAHPKRPVQIPYPKDDYWRFYQIPGGQYRSTPDLSRMLTRTRINQKKQKYTLPGFAEVNPGDYVVDVGAFIGGFTHHAASVCDEVLAIEPSPKTVQCLQDNVRHLDNTSVFHSAITDDTGNVKLNIGECPTDNSILNVDEGQSVGNETVSATTLTKVMKKYDYNTIDFLKVDAEGAEPEVLRGAPYSNIKKLAIDCGAERYGKPTDDKVLRILENQGFATKVNGNVVFANSANAHM